MERDRLERIVREAGGEAHAGGAWFCTDPGWTPARRSEAVAVMALPDPVDRGGLGWLGIPTGGTSGVTRFARHDEGTLGTAVAGFCAYFGLGRVNAVDVLPSHHVSGLMARVRCAASGGEHLPWSWKRLESGDRPALARHDDGWVISLVPTQLQRLLATAGGAEWLRRFRIVFLGGGPVWPALVDAASQARVPVSLTYGMTETAAMVVASLPGNLPVAARNCGRALPHARVTVDESGVICIEAGSLFRGYWPEWREEKPLITGDAGMVADDGSVVVTGRRDWVIITGGKKVQPERVEAALRVPLLGGDVVVVGVPDDEWGEKVVACVPASVNAAVEQEALAELAPHERPKLWLTIDPWPAGPQGKVDRSQLRAAAASRIAGAARPG